MTMQSAYISTMRHKSKRYQAYLEDAKHHNQSICDKYGMPPIARPPLTDDIVERIIKLTYVTKRVWNKSL